MAQQCNVSLSSDDELFFTAVAQTYRYHNKSAVKVDKANVTQIALNFIRGVSQRLEVGLEGDMELLGQLSNYFGMIFVSAEPLKADDPIAGGIAQNQSWILKAVQSELSLWNRLLDALLEMMKLLVLPFVSVLLLSVGKLFEAIQG